MTAVTAVAAIVAVIKAWEYCLISKLKNALYWVPKAEANASMEARLSAWLAKRARQTSHMMTEKISRPLRSH